MTAPTDGVAAHWFVVPSLDGPITGGTRYNAELIFALRALGVATEVMPPARAAESLRHARSADPSVVWVDSLFLEQVGLLAHAAAGRARVGLLTHYLPSLVALGPQATASELSPLEGAALASADVFLVSGSYMRDKLCELRQGEPERPIWLIEPGREQRAPRAVAARAQGASVQALMIANLVPGKNVARFLAALALELSADDPLRLKIVGSQTMDPEYAARCGELIAHSSALAGRVELTGALAHDATLAELAEAELLISASTLETYGMALAEARTLGVPLLARAGGNVESLVDACAGGELFTSDAELARACVALARDARLLAMRRVLAEGARLPARTWRDAARELLACSSRSGSA